MKANKLFRISEIMWLVVAIGCILTDLFIFIIVRDNQKGVFFLGLTFMAALMYSVRRKMRIRADASEAGQEPSPAKQDKKDSKK
jgi:hypothetical protein